MRCLGWDLGICTACFLVFAFVQWPKYFYNSEVISKPRDQIFVCTWCLSAVLTLLSIWVRAGGFHLLIQFYHGSFLPPYKNWICILNSISIFLLCHFFLGTSPENTVFLALAINKWSVEQELSLICYYSTVQGMFLVNRKTSEKKKTTKLSKVSNYLQKKLRSFNEKNTVSLGLQEI